MTSSELLISARDANALASLSHVEVLEEVVSELAKRDEDLTIVTAGLSDQWGLDQFGGLQPGAYVQCGQGEQNQVEVASALANESFTVLAPSRASLIVSRSFNQLYTNLGMMASPVILVGMNCGCDASILGRNHMALEDIACMRQVPGLLVASPSDNAEFAAILLELAEDPRPAYVRMNEAHGANLHPNGVGHIRGRAQLLLRPPAGGSEVSFVTCGTITSAVLEAARMLHAYGVQSEVLEMATINPLDYVPLDQLSARKLIVTVEEHGVTGGLGSAVAEHLARRGNHPAVLRMGVPPYLVETDDPAHVLKKAGLDAHGIANRVLSALDS